MGRLFAVLILLSVGCRRETPEARPDPITKTKSSSPVEPSPTSGEAPAKTGVARCVVGDGASPVTIEGSATEAVESVTKAELDDAFCAHLPEAQKCVAAITRGDKVFEATLEAKLEIGPDGRVKAMLDGGTLRDQAMRSCVRDALLATQMPNGPGSGRYSVRVLARRK